MASALGVNVNRVYVQAFTLGCFMAGLGGAIIVPQPGGGAGHGRGRADPAPSSWWSSAGSAASRARWSAPSSWASCARSGITFFPEIELAVLYLIAAVVLLIRPAGLFGRA